MKKYSVYYSGCKIYDMDHIMQNEEALVKAFVRCFAEDEEAKLNFVVIEKHICYINMGSCLSIRILNCNTI